MSKEKFRGAPPVAKHDLDTSSVEYKELSTLVWSVFDYVLGKLDMRARQDFYIASLLKSMRETHKSMRAILGVAADYEKQTGQQTGSHYDAVLLARPQIESVFIGLLILYDERKYVPWYQKAGWAAGARARHYYCISVSDATPIGMQWCRNAQDMYKKIAISLGITKAEEEATYAYIRGDELTDEEKDNRIKEFPTVGKMMDEQNKDGHMLKGSSFEGLAELLLRQTKSRCAFPEASAVKFPKSPTCLFFELCPACATASGLKCPPADFPFKSLQSPNW